MAFFNVDNEAGKNFILKYVEDQMDKKAVSSDELEGLYKAESRRKSDWKEWTDFQFNCRTELKSDSLSQELQLMDQKYRINNEVNDLNIISMTDEFSRRNRYVRRLKCIPHLLSDEEYKVARSEVEQIYQELLERIPTDALEEVKEKIVFNNSVLDLNDRFSVPTNSAYFLNDKKREKLDREVAELQNLQSIIESGEYSLMGNKKICYDLCYESAISCFKSFYVSHYEKKEEDDFGLGGIKF